MSEESREKERQSFPGQDSSQGAPFLSFRNIAFIGEYDHHTYTCECIQVYMYGLLKNSKGNTWGIIA